MGLKHTGLGFFILLAVLTITACGGGNESSTPHAAIVSTPTLNIFSGNMEFVIKSDTVDLAPGSSFEIETPTSLPSEPIYSSVIIKSIQFSIPEGTIEPEIRFMGTVPTICNRILFKIDPIDSKNQIIIHIFTTAKLNSGCLKREQLFDQTIRLTKVPTGTYTVWINGNKLGEYSVP
jgi:hypothetical protein